MANYLRIERSISFLLASASLIWPSVGHCLTEIGAHAHNTLTARCATCHADGKMAQDVFGNVLDTQNLIAKGLIKPGYPEDSKLVKQIESGSMPLTPPKLTGPEIDGIKAWITELGAQQARTCISESKLEAEAADDLQSLPPAERKNTRYLSLGAIYSSGGPDAVKSAILAITKALNSVSVADSIVIPQVAGKSGMLLRFNTSGMFSNPTSDWEAIQTADPLKSTHQTKEIRQKLLDLSGSSFPVVRGDFFADAVLQAPLYNRLLLGTDTNEEDVEKFAGVNRLNDIANGRVVRSGFLHSGVSVNNRVIERHDSKFGAYWISYDFSDSVGNHNIFSHPTSFDRSGGEAIFNLPNGMQAYMLVNHDGKKLDEAPLAIVSDPKRPDRAVQNAISCFRCHASGLNDGDDQIRDHVAADPQLFSSRVKSDVAALYPTHGVFESKLKADSARYQTALAQIDSSLATATEANDPLLKLTNNFEGNLSLDQAACEAELTPDQLVQSIHEGGSQLGDISGLGSTCDIARNTFENSFPQLRADIVNAVQATIESSPAAVSARAASSVVAAKSGGASSLAGVTAAMENAVGKINNPVDFLKVVDPIVKSPTPEAQAATDQFIAKHLGDFSKLNPSASDYEKLKDGCIKLSTCSAIMKGEAGVATTKAQMLQAFNPGVSSPSHEYLADIDPIIQQNVAKLPAMGAGEGDYASLFKQAVTSDTKLAVLQAAATSLKDDQGQLSNLLTQVGSGPQNAQIVQTFKTQNSQYFH